MLIANKATEKAVNFSFYCIYLEEKHRMAHAGALYIKIDYTVTVIMKRFF